MPNVLSPRDGSVTLRRKPLCRRLFAEKTLGRKNCRMRHFAKKLSFFSKFSQYCQKFDFVPEFQNVIRNIGNSDNWILHVLSFLK